MVRLRCAAGTRFLALALTTACGGPPAAAPGTASSSAPTPAPAATAAAAAPATADPRASVLQLALDLPEMDGYWHIDVRPDRVPLKVAPHHGLPVPMTLEKFGEAVVVEKGAPLRFETIAIQRDSARVDYRYEPEGLIVEVRLESDGKTWRVVDADVAER